MYVNWGVQSTCAPYPAAMAWVNGMERFTERPTKRWKAAMNHRYALSARWAVLAM